MTRSAPDLFDYTPAPYRGEPPAQHHSPTSKAAAEQIKKAIGPLHKQILAVLKVRPMTDEEIMSACIMGGNTERPRRRELQLLGEIEDSGETRLTRSGRAAVVWRIAV